MRALRVEESIRIERPVDRVFQAWSTAKRLGAWFAPMAAQPPRVEMDFREGGSFRIEMDLGPGGVHVTTGTFVRIVPNSRIQMTWRCDAWSDGPSDVDVLFEPTGDATVVLVTHTKITSEPAQEGQRFGWQQCLGQLRTILHSSPDQEPDGE